MASRSVSGLKCGAEVMEVRQAASSWARWSALGVLLFLPLAAWYSLLQLADLAGSETPLAFVVLVPVLAAYMLVRDGRAPAASRGQSDPFLDGLMFFILFGLCLLLLFFLPPRLSWYYWMLRLDLLIIPLFATAIVVFLWGLGGTRVLRRPLLYLLLVWTLPMVWLQQTLGPVLVGTTAAAGTIVVRLLDLPLDWASDDIASFVSTGPEPFTLVIAETCSGVNGVLGFLLVGLPLALVWSGTAGAKARWLAAGALLAFASNLLRVGLLLYLSSRVGVDFAVGTVHPFLGTALFVLAFAAMLGLAGRFGLGLVRPSLPPIEACQLSFRPDGLGTRASIVGAAALVLALGQTSLTQFAPVSASTLPAAAVVEPWAVLPEVPGWEREWRPEVNWQDLFGPEAKARVAIYRSGQASAAVQFVATPDKRALDTYSPEQCDQFHGLRLVGVSTVDLGYGISARLIESELSRTGRGTINVNTLYWLMPVTVGGELYHARIAIMTDVEMIGSQPSVPGAQGPNPIIQWRDRLLSVLSPYPPAGSRPDFADLDGYTVSFGREMVGAIMAQGEGPLY